MSPPSSGSGNTLRKAPELATRFMLVSCFGYSSALMKEATCCLETSVDFKWARIAIIQMAKMFKTVLWVFLNVFQHSGDCEQQRI
jgi:hypothetical protein